MRSIGQLVAAAALFAIVPANAQNWAKYTSQLDRFEIFVPGGEFEIEETDWDSEYGAVMPARVYRHAENGATYTVTVVDFTDARGIHSRRDRTEADYELYWEVDVRASIAYAAWLLRKRGGEVTYDAYHYIDRIEGHQLQITNENQSRTFAAIYLHDSKLYIAEATVPPGSIPPGFFQQSLQWIDAEGGRIRYRNFSEAPKVRDAPVR
ncbi:MAG TPA: hypothetical protein VIV14_12275 [Gammaproteobacteria bacterium]